MMMRMAKKIGRATSTLAFATISSRVPSGDASRRSRSMFSTMTMVPSTIMPIAIASPPKDIRLAEMPKRRMPTNAVNTENGMARATTRLGRTPPMKNGSTSTTRPMPIKSADVTVPTAASTRLFCW